MSDNTIFVSLKDLNDVIATTKAKVKDFSKPAEFGISTAFSEALRSAFPDYSFEFYERTIKVTTPNKQYIYVSGQSFALAVCLMDFCEEIGRYRTIAYRILNNNREAFEKLTPEQGRIEDKVFTALRDKTNPQLTDTFKAKTLEFFNSNCDNKDMVTANTDLLMKFLTDYNWWLGGKQISRSNDWCISPISTLLNMPQNDSNFIARVVSKATENTGFRDTFKQAIENEWGADIRSAELLPVRKATVNFSKFPHNRILFGAPGTGKSFTLNQEKDSLLSNGGEYERVTFHPDYTYANFVGTYKPVPCQDSDGKDAITYSYVPGPFMRTYVKAIRNSRTDTPKPYLLVIEEINRANVAAVFGDVFQLLDRADDEVSEYPIQASEDIKKFLALPENLGGTPEDYAEIRIPNNMFIWATMNSADQGVFPMDTAFKRRWDFTYLGIDDNEANIAGKKVILGQGDYRRCIEWNELRKAINNELLKYRVNEDKLMGPYFISKKNLPEGEMFDSAAFSRIFKSKVIMYLFDDAAKQRRPSLFGGCDEKAQNQYSKICSEFDTKGVYIFCQEISDQFIDKAPEDDEA